MKTTILWIIILALSLRVYGYWIDHEHAEKARDRWISKASEMLNTLADIACADENKNKTKEELRTLAETYIDKIWLVKFDADFTALSKKEQVLFYTTSYKVIQLFHEACRKSTSNPIPVLP